VRNFLSTVKIRALHFAKPLAPLFLSLGVFAGGVFGFAGDSKADTFSKEPPRPPTPLSLFFDSVSAPEPQVMPVPRRPINKVTEQMIKGFEQLRLAAYDDANGQTIFPGQRPKGIVTIGWGHTGDDVKPGDSCTVEDAERFFRQDILWACNAVDSLVKVPLTENQYGALVCFTYNVGKNGFANSTLLRLLNAGDYESVPKQLMQWTKVGRKVRPGLMRRRAAECYVFAARDIDQNVTLEDLMRKQQMIKAYNTAVESDLSYVRALDAINRQTNYPYFHDQWWKDFYNDIALEHYVALLAQDYMDVPAPEKLDSQTRQKLGVVPVIFNSAAAQNGFSIRYAYGKNERMQQAFDYVDLERAALTFGRESKVYLRRLAKAEEDKNPYLGLSLRDVYMELISPQRTEGVFEVIERLNNVAAPWVNGIAPPTNSIRFGA